MTGYDDDHNQDHLVEVRAHSGVVPLAFTTVEVITGDTTRQVAVDTSPGNLVAQGNYRAFCVICTAQSQIRAVAPGDVIELDFRL